MRVRKFWGGGVGRTKKTSGEITQQDDTHRPHDHSNSNGTNRATIHHKKNIYLILLFDTNFDTILLSNRIKRDTHKKYLLSICIYI